jgi:hypothetical protein
MDHDGKDYDQKKARYDQLLDNLAQQRTCIPKRVTDKWMELRDDIDLQLWWELFTLAYSIFDDRTGGIRAEKIHAHLRRRRERKK